MHEISDAQLVGDLKGLLATDSRIEARVVAHLAELDARKLHLLAGRSLWHYCQQELGLSDNQAFYRITAARAARRFPILFDLLAQRAIHLTTVALISKYLTAENHLDIFEAVRGASKREVLKTLARRFPRADVENQIRRLPPGLESYAAGPTGTLEPLSETSYRLQLNVSERVREKLDLARDLMSHSNRSGDLAVIVERALDVLIDDLKKRRFGQTSSPRKSSIVRTVRKTTRSGRSSDDMGRPNQKARPGGKARAHIPNEVRRQVAARDGLRCTYCSEDGQRCTERAFLQFDHEHAWARGGPETLDNLRLRCAAHNQLGAEQEFGAERVREARGANER